MILGGWYEAQEGYTGVKEDELTFRQGQVMEVIRKSLDGWWTAM